jgi:hypothetical protein
LAHEALEIGDEGSDTGFDILVLHRPVQCLCLDRASMLHGRSDTKVGGAGPP